MIAYRGPRDRGACIEEARLVGVAVAVVAVVATVGVAYTPLTYVRGGGA